MSELAPFVVILRMCPVQKNEKNGKKKEEEKQ